MQNTHFSRRKFLQLCGGITAASAFGWNNISAATKSRVLIIGGGAAGSIVARYLLQQNPGLDVSIIEKNKTYDCAFMSNQLLSGSWQADRFSFNYQSIISRGIKLIQDEVSNLDQSSNTLHTTSGQKIPYDKLVFTAGAEADQNKIQNLSSDNIKQSAWTNAQDVVALYNRIKTLKSGGKILVSIPVGEINGLLAAYERVSHLAMHLSQHNKKAKILLVSDRTADPIQKLFSKVWQEKYPGIIEIQNGMATQINKDNSIVVNGKPVTADIINLIPPQKANKLADTIGLTDDSGWCPVHAASFESTKVKNVHIIGDAIKGFDGFHKNAQMANSQAKILAYILNSLLNSNKLPSVLPPLIDAEYGIIAKDYGISATRVFRFENNNWNTVTNDISSLDAKDKQKQREFAYAESWFNNITHEMFS